MKRILLISVGVLVVAVAVFVIKNVAKEPPRVSQDQPAVVTSQSPAAAARLRSGSFTKIDTIHYGSGTAAFYRTGDRAELRFESDFSVNNGPDLYVYLSKNPNAAVDRQLGEDVVSLGKLQSLSGSQTYALPANHQDYQAVFIWCRAFSVPFSVAPLQETP